MRLVLSVLTLVGCWRVSSRVHSPHFPPARPMQNRATCGTMEMWEGLQPWGTLMMSQI